MKKYSLEGLTGEQLESAKNFNEIIDSLAALKSSNEELTSIKSQLEELKSKGGVTTEQYDSLKESVEEIGTEIAKQSKGGKEVQSKTLQDVIVDEIKSLGVNTISELKNYLITNGNKRFEVKAITAVASTANTDTIGRTNLDTNVAWSPVRKPAFLQRFRTISEQNDKSKFGYTEGSYTGAAAYVGEGTGNANSDSASASALFMDYAKVQAVLSVDTEVYEDIPDFAAGLVNQMQLAAQKFIDDEAYSGDGLAPAGVQHIKGLLSYATAVNFTTNMLPYAATVKAANIKNLVDAIKSYIDNLDGNYIADVVFMNPVDYYKMSQLKDTSNQPLFTYNAMGMPMLSGLEVVTSHKVAANTILVMDSMIAEWRTKRSMTLQLGQLLANDAINDKRSAILSARYQLLIRNLDKVAIMKVTDVAAAITALTAA